MSHNLFLQHDVKNCTCSCKNSIIKSWNLTIKSQWHKIMRRKQNRAISSRSFIVNNSHSNSFCELFHQRCHIRRLTRVLHAERKVAGSNTSAVRYLRVSASYDVSPRKSIYQTLEGASERRWVPSRGILQRWSAGVLLRRRTTPHDTPKETFPPPLLARARARVRSVTLKFVVFLKQAASSCFTRWFRPGSPFFFFQKRGKRNEKKKRY